MPDFSGTVWLMLEIQLKYPLMLFTIYIILEIWKHIIIT